ncbi:MAG TPA: hypothetical protein VK879_01765 [Candidatus Sulfomarinibacteraceae bacterium]|nr:hypothetical protein [Candidatus Sulfomarinibacteraceae bacterium]
MTTVASLFESQQEATAALDALAQSEFADIPTEVYENGGEADEDADVGAVPEPGTSRVLAAPYDVDLIYGLDQEARSYFLRKAQQGAVLVLADVEKERVDDLQAFFEAHGGQTAKG